MSNHIGQELSPYWLAAATTNATPSVVLCKSCTNPSLPTLKRSRGYLRGATHSMTKQETDVSSAVASKAQLAMLMLPDT